MVFLPHCYHQNNLENIFGEQIVFFFSEHSQHVASPAFPHRTRMPTYFLILPYLRTRVIRSLKLKGFESRVRVFFFSPTLDLSTTLPCAQSSLNDLVEDWCARLQRRRSHHKQNLFSVGSLQEDGLELRVPTSGHKCSTQLQILDWWLAAITSLGV